MQIQCQHCGTGHKLNAAQMSVVIERMQKGYGHRFARLTGDNWKPTVNVVSVCILTMTPVRTAAAGRR